MPPHSDAPRPLPLLEKRHSGKNFDPDKRVPARLLETIFHGAQLAPSCFNEQPWRFIVCDRYTEARPYDLVLETLDPANRTWAQHAPILIVGVAMGIFQRNGRANRWAPYDTGAASLILCLEAAELGLATHQMGGFDEERLRQAFNIPPHAQPFSVIALGYELPDSGTAASPKKRFPLSHNFYRGQWLRGMDFED